MITFSVKIESDFKFPESKVSDILMGVGAEIEKSAKMVAPVDTGLMRSEIHYSMVSPFEVQVTSGVNYDIYWEFGTERHFVPFFTRGGGEITSLGHWAMRVLGMSEEDLAKKGGLQIKTPAIKLYSKGMEEAMKNLDQIVEAAFKT